MYDFNIIHYLNINTIYAIYKNKCYYCYFANNQQFTMLLEVLPFDTQVLPC